MLDYADPERCIFVAEKLPIYRHFSLSLVDRTFATDKSHTSVTFLVGCRKKCFAHIFGGWAELQLAIETVSFVDALPQTLLYDAFRLLQFKCEAPKALVEQSHPVAFVVGVGRHHFVRLRDAQILVFSKRQLVHLCLWLRWWKIYHGLKLILLLVRGAKPHLPDLIVEFRVRVPVEPILFQLPVVVLIELGPDSIGEDLHPLVDRADELLCPEDCPHNLFVDNVVEVDAWVPAGLSFSFDVELEGCQDEEFGLSCVTRA